MEAQILLADPPWVTETWSEKGQGRSPKYPKLTVESMAKLDMDRLCAKDCALLMWSTYPHMPQAVWLMKEWGFRYGTVVFTWVKTVVDPKATARKLAKRGASLDDIMNHVLAASTDIWPWGGGHMTRANPEFCLLGWRGKGLRRRDAGVHNLIFAPRLRPHSTKPHEQYERIQKLFGPIDQKLEIFARHAEPGWIATGLDLDGKYIEDFIAEQPENTPRERARRARGVVQLPLIPGSDQVPTLPGLISGPVAQAAAQSRLDDGAITL
jgi:N6-adenosine-specific RNA methylase IME4